MAPPPPPQPIIDIVEPFTLNEKDQNVQFLLDQEQQYALWNSAV